MIKDLWVAVLYEISFDIQSFIYNRWLWSVCFIVSCYFSVFFCTVRE